MSFEIRKIVTYSEETRIEGGKATDTPVTMVGLAVVIKNPGPVAVSSRTSSLRSAPTAPTSAR